MVTDFSNWSLEDLKNRREDASKAAAQVKKWLDEGKENWNADHLQFFEGQLTEIDTELALPERQQPTVA